MTLEKLFKTLPEKQGSIVLPQPLKQEAEDSEKWSAIGQSDRKGVVQMN